MHQYYIGCCRRPLTCLICKRALKSPPKTQPHMLKCKCIGDIQSQKQMLRPVSSDYTGVLSHFLMLSRSVREQRLTAAGIDASGPVSIIILAPGLKHVLLNHLSSTALLWDPVDYWAEREREIGRESREGMKERNKQWVDMCPHLPTLLPWVVRPWPVPAPSLGEIHKHWNIHKQSHQAAPSWHWNVTITSLSIQNFKKCSICRTLSQTFYWATLNV